MWGGYKMTEHSTMSDDNETSKAVRVLVIGYGNPGRCDDGLGPAFAHRIQLIDLPHVTVESNYQLNVEDAAEIAKHDLVIFVDASVNCPRPFEFRHVLPRQELDFSSHSVSPEALLAMVCDVFHRHVNGFMLAIRGHTFDEYSETLSQIALDNLEAAVRFFESASDNPELLHEWACDQANGATTSDDSNDPDDNDRSRPRVFPEGT